MESDLSPQQPFNLSLPFDFGASLAAQAEDERVRAHESLRPLGKLPPRPNLEWYRSEAKTRHKALTQAGSSDSLNQTQHRLARELGFRSWPEFVRTLNDRNRQAAKFSAALHLGNGELALEMLTANPSAVVDVAMTAHPDHLHALVDLARGGPASALHALHMVAFALARYGSSQDLPWQIHAIVLPDLDWEAVMRLLHDRKHEADLDQGREADATLLEEAISVLAPYDEPELDVSLDDD